MGLGQEGIRRLIGGALAGCEPRGKRCHQRRHARDECAASAAATAVVGGLCIRRLILRIRRLNRPLQAADERGAATE